MKFFLELVLGLVVFFGVLGVFGVITGVVVCLTPTASAASFGHRKMLVFFCDTHLARFFDIVFACGTSACTDFN